MKYQNKSKFRTLISRRNFINKAVAGTAAFAFSPYQSFAAGAIQDSAKWPADAAGYRFHMIGHAHIDPVWLWPWPEGLSVVHSTFRTALDRMNETPDFTFTASSAQFYQWVAENDPEMLEEIRKRVDEGRWSIAGGWWVEPDVNIPSGEALVRQGLYGQRTFQRLLGRRATVAFNPDSFGHAGTLPQILKQQGMDNYIFMRPMQHEKNLPSDLFWWEGQDGTKLLTYRIQISYNETGSVRTRLQQTIPQVKNQPFRTYMSFYGAGDHGGGATKENIVSIQEIKKETGAPEIVFSTPENFFTEIRNGTGLKLPTVKDDLQHHAVGCYTAESEIKKGNRLSEAALITAEKIASIGSSVWGANYPQQELTKAWEHVLFLQFHDSLAGTSVPEHSQTAREGYGYALDTAHHAVYSALQKLEWQIPSHDPSSQYMLAFNPHAWEAVYNLEYDFNRDLKKSSVAEDESGNPLPHQWVKGSTETGSRRTLLVRTSIPAFGYRQIRLREGIPPEISHPVTAGENRMENEYIRVIFSESGTVGITDKETGKETFFKGTTGCRAVVIDDPSDTWSHDVKSFNKEYGSFGNASFVLTEKGPLRATARITTMHGLSGLSVDWMLTAGSRCLEARVKLDWHEKLKILKFSFPVNVFSPVVTYEIPYGTIIRQANGDEEPGQRWIDITGETDGEKSGLTVFNNAKYGYSADGNVMNISVARSAVYAHHIPRVLDMDSEHNWQDQGIQTFRMLLVPHRGKWQTNGITRIAEEFISPAIIIYQGIHDGTLPRAGSFLSIDAENVIVTSLKKSESDNDLIIRCVETTGTPVTAIIDFKFLKHKWTGSFLPYEIKSLRVDTRSGEVRKSNLLEE